MSERERWIVYPLLFFALGAALRDKVLQQVEAKEIVCERIRLVDHHDPTKILAELGSKTTARSGEPETTTFLRVDELLCEGVHIADRKNPGDLLVELGSTATPSVRPGETPRRVGFVLLRDNTNSQVTEVRADQILGNRIACRQLLVLDPVNARPLVLVGTEAVADGSLGGNAESVSYQGVIYLNNQRLGIRLAPPARRPANSAAP